jgi:hypothetical protein
VLLVYTLFEIPLEIAFIDPSCNMSSLDVFNLIVDIMFCIDIMIAFHTGYYIKLQGENILEDNHWLIAKRYIQGWFAVDLVSSIPVERFVCLALADASSNSDEDSNNSMTLLRAFKVARFLKLARLVRFNRMLNKWQMMSVKKWQLNITRIFKLVIMLLMICHFIGCSWQIVANELGKKKFYFPCLLEMKMHAYESTSKIILSPSNTRTRNPGLT